MQVPLPQQRGSSVIWNSFMVALAEMVPWTPAQRDSAQPRLILRPVVQRPCHSHGPRHTLTGDARLKSTDREWERWGALDPYFGVLTDPRFRAVALTDDAKADFFESGRGHAMHVLHLCRHHFAPDFKPDSVLDFGCGVGRVLIPLAHIASRAVGMDISPSMLAEARRNADARNAGHVELVVSDDTLSQAQGQFDLVHSCIVLQHIETERGRLLFDQLVRKVKPGGFGAIQVTFGLDRFPDTFGQPPPPVPPSLLRQARQQARQLLTVTTAGAREAEQQDDAAGVRDPEMQMNLYNLSELMYVLHHAGVRNMHTQLTDHGGVVGAFIVFGRPVH